MKNVKATKVVKEVAKAKKTTEKETPAKVVVETVVKAKGRPSNPESARQKRIAERNAKREAGILKRGRPTVEGSKRQIVMAAREAKKAAGIEIKRGRPKQVKEATDIVQLERGE